MRTDFRGFTLLELIITIGILTIISVATLSGLMSFRAESALRKAVDNAENVLKDARSKTLSSINGYSYGVYFTASTTTLFRGLSYAPAATTTNEILYLPQEVEISNVTLSASSTAFRRLTGEATATGTVTFRLKRSPTKTKTITIYGSGLYATQ